MEENKIKELLREAYFKLPSESFELFYKNLDIFLRMWKAWIDFSSMQAASSEDLFRKMNETFKGIYEQMFDVFFRPYRSLLYPFEVYRESVPWTPWSFVFSDLAQQTWSDLFKSWSKTVMAPYFPYFPSKEVFEAYVNLWKSWTETYLRFLREWVEVMSKTLAEQRKRLEEISKEMFEKK